MKPRDRTNTTTGSTLSPGDSSVYSFNIVLLLPPAPAARVLEGRAFATCAALSAAVFRRMTALGPPGTEGDDCRAEERTSRSEPEVAPAGEDARGDEDWRSC